MNKKIGFIGVGNMGGPMATNLIDAGFEVTVYDIDPKKVAKLAAVGAKIANRPGEVISKGCIVITMLPNDKAVTDLMLGNEGLAASLSAAESHISMSTISPETVEELATVHKQHATTFVVAPVLGRPIAAETRKLWIFLAGPKDAKLDFTPIFDALGQGKYDFGEKLSSASTVKLGVNFLILAAIESMGEAFAFIKKNNLDCGLFAKMVTETLFECVAYKYHANNIVTNNFTPAGFRMDLGKKDIHLLREKAHQVDVPMPIANLLHDRLLSSLANNRNELDWAGITIKSLEDAGIM